MHFELEFIIKEQNPKDENFNYKPITTFSDNIQIYLLKILHKISKKNNEN